MQKDLEKQGYLSIKSWFSKAKAPQASREVEEIRNNQDSDVEMARPEEGDQDMVSASESNSVRYLRP
jgi:hypothetical protein